MHRVITPHRLLLSSILAFAACGAEAGDLIPDEEANERQVQANTGTCPATVGPMSVDGTLSEKDWNLSQKVSRSVIGTGNNTVTFGTLWDTKYLYVGVKVLDGSLRKDSTHPWDDDSVEIYIDGGHNHSTAYDSNDRQFNLSYNRTTLSELRGGTAGVLHGWAAVSGGYTVELAVPWSNLGVAPKDGMTIGLDIGVNDDDNGGARDSQMMWNGTASNWQSASAFGDLTLTKAGSDPKPASGQCSASAVPRPAKDHGLTRLAFCEDFSDPKRINLGTTLVSGQTFTQVSSGNIFNASPLPASAISFSNGTMTVKPTHNQYQVDFISSLPSGAGFMLHGSGWYAEIRWKHSNCQKSSGFPAFWSMDARHLYGQPGGDFSLEPDFYEYINGSYVGALHNWNWPGHQRTSQQTVQGMPVDPTQYFVAGAMAEANNGGYAWYLNDKQMARKVPSWIGMFSQFRGPVMFGSGPGCDYTVDYVRVWTK